MGSDLVRLSVFTTGRALFVLKLLSEMDTIIRRPALLRAIQRAQAAANAARSLNLKWWTQLGRSGARGRASEIDNDIDRNLGAIGSRCRSLVDALGADDDLGGQAVDFMERWFPQSVVAVTTLPFEDELEEVEELLAGTTGEGVDAATAEALGLAPFLRKLTALVPKFRAELEKQPVGSVTLNEVRAVRKVMHEALCVVVAGLVYEFAEEAAEVQAAVRKPVEDQEARLSDLRRGRRRVVVDVDPISGVEETTESAEGTHPPE